MFTQTFINLPVKNLNQSKQFFTSLGLTFDPLFTNHQSACLIINDSVKVMLLSRTRFQAFIKKDIPDTKIAAEVIVSLRVQQRSNVDSIIKKAVVAGATTPTKPQQHEHMYGHGFQDLDGHMWEVFWMDQSKIVV